MKSLLFVCFCAYLVQGNKVDDLITHWIEICKPYHDECVKESGVHPQLALDMIPTTTYDSEKRKCYLACLNKRLGLMNSDNTFNIDVFTGLCRVPATIASTCMERSNNINDACENAFITADCVAGLMKQHLAD